jgi:hypothetical protein
MPQFKSGIPGRVFGEGVFENDAALRAVSYLNELAGVGKLKPTDSANGDKATYSVYAKQCSTPEAAEKVRVHLDSGVLHKLTAKMVANYFNPLSVDDYTCFRYVPVILGACAMSHGCRTLYDAPGYRMFFNKYKEVLIGIFESAPFMDAAKEQMKKALLGPEGFQPGIAIDFARFARPPNHSPPKEDNSCIGLMIGGIPAGYKSKYTHGDGKIMHMIGPCSKGDMGYSDDKKLCGGCEMYHGKSLVCSRCKDQVYCSKACQRKDFSRHKVACRTPEDAKTMLEDEFPKWMNSFYVDADNPSGGSPGMASMADLADRLGMPFDVRMGAEFMNR